MPRKKRFIHQEIFNLLKFASINFFDDLPGISHYRFTSDWKTFGSIEINPSQFKLSVDRCLRYEYSIPCVRRYNGLCSILRASHQFENVDYDDPIGKIRCDLFTFDQSIEDLKIIEDVMEERAAVPMTSLPDLSEALYG